MMPWLPNPPQEELHHRRHDEDRDDDRDLPRELVGELVGAVAAELLVLGRHPLAGGADAPRRRRVATAALAERLRSLGAAAVRTGPHHFTFVRSRGLGAPGRSAAP